MLSFKTFKCLFLFLNHFISQTSLNIQNHSLTNYKITNVK